MKRAVSVSLGSSKRNKRVTITLGETTIQVERIGTDGDTLKAKQMFEDLDGQVDAFGIGGVDLYLRLDKREYPLRAALKLVQGVHYTPIVDGRGLKHTLERRVFERSASQLPPDLSFQRAFIPVAADRLGLAHAIEEKSDRVDIGDLMVALGIPIVVPGIAAYHRLARILFPIVSHFPMRLLYYGSDGREPTPKYHTQWQQADLWAGDFLFMRKHMPLDLSGKAIVTNTTTSQDVDLLRQRGARFVLTTTPRYEGRSFGTNLMEAALTAYAGKGRPLTSLELNALIDDLDLRPHIEHLNS